MYKCITYVLVFVAVCQFGVSMAQVEKERCSTEKYIQQQLTKNPNLQSELTNVEAEVRKWLSLHKQNEKYSKTNYPVISIPVVIHILYNENAPEDNLPMEQILSQIDVLNQDYQFRNADRNNIPPIFQDLAANIDIEFCLASRDPNGAFTEGVTRTKLPADIITFSLDNDQIKRPLGYSSSPGFSASIDGVAISTRYFGKGSQFNLHPSYNKGRTT